MSRIPALVKKLERFAFEDSDDLVPGDAARNDADQTKDLSPYAGQRLPEDPTQVLSLL